MALDKDRLKNKIKQIMQDMMTRENNSIDEFADRLAQAVVDEVKEASIVYYNGLAAPSGGGAVTGTFNGELQ